ncbi:hypothetical protein WMY93_020670 [Mugilogobius chulae]|uniref:Secreted protein n=1 Tax=Mugilogobius chulae TaxID=88201 RepID=A0AAW0NBP5_9GOBI
MASAWVLPFLHSTSAWDSDSCGPVSLSFPVRHFRWQRLDLLDRRFSLNDFTAITKEPTNPKTLTTSRPCATCVSLNDILTGHYGGGSEVRASGTSARRMVREGVKEKERVCVVCV